MSNILVKTELEQNDLDTLINKNIPHYRQAYSDRTSWMMACLSELAYVKFNEPFFDTKNQKLIDSISTLIDEEKITSLKKL